jgi:hypothetical protein
MRVVGTLLLALVAACTPRSATKVQDATTVDASRELKSKSDFRKLIGEVEGAEPVVKFTLFKNSGDIYFQNTAKYQYHLQFLNNMFEEYKTLNMGGFEQLIFSEPPTLLAGGIYWLDGFTAADLPEPGILGFNTYFAEANGAPGFNAEYVKMVHKRLSETVAYAPGKIAYIFQSAPAFFKNRNTLAQIGIKSYPVNAIMGKSDKARVYSAAKSYGYLRKITSAEFAAGDYSSKDILLFDEVPIDIGPVSGVISANPQVPHSHVIFRSVNMKIPDLFVPNAGSVAAIANNLGKLVEFTTSGENSWTIRGADEIPNIAELAQAYFAQRVPALPELRANLQEANVFDFASAGASPALSDRYGAKGTNFALLDLALRKGGVDRQFANGSFLIPYSFNATHMAQRLTSTVCGKASEKCAKSYAGECSAPTKICMDIAGRGGTLRDFALAIAAPGYTVQMLASGGLRKASLFTVQYVIKKTEMVPAHLAQIKGLLSQRWSPTTRVRFRSSSNVEDLPGLTGAGLYSSHSGCLADEGLASGPSRCMTKLEYDRIVARITRLRALNNPELQPLIADLQESLTDTDLVADAVRKVFASLWYERAFLSRDYYRIPHDKAYMAVLVHPSFADDSANGVVVVEAAGSGIRSDVVVQQDDISITNPEIPGAVPEEVVVTTGAAPQYITRSNQVPAGGTVLSQAQLDDLQRQLKIVFDAFTALGLNKTGRLDVEIKRNQQGQMQIKQTRSL